MATINFSGNINGSVAVADNSIGNLNGVHSSGIEGFDNGVLNVHDFSGVFRMHDSSVAQVSGGNGDFALYNDSVANVSGGTWGTNELYDNSIVNLTGGQLGYMEAYAMFDNSVLNVFGTGLSLEHDSGAYWNLRGTLADGTQIPDFKPIVIFDNAVVNLYEIPEPSTLIFAAFGFAGLAAWGWRRPIARVATD